MFQSIFLYLNFNPRSYKRSDMIGYHTGLRLGISIHAPTRGATAIAVPEIVGVEFQSTLLQEERQLY